MSTINDDIARAIMMRPEIAVIVVAHSDFGYVERDAEGKIMGVPVVPSRAEYSYSGTYAFWQDWSGQPCIEMVRQ